MAETTDNATSGSETIKVQFHYGVDTSGTGEGFFWLESEQKRKEALSVRRNSPSDFESTYQGNPGAREGSIFIESDFAYYDPPENLEAGILAPDVKKYCKHGHGIFQAWDTAFSDTIDSAYTVGVTGLFVPCDRYHCDENPQLMGFCDNHFDIIILDVFRKKLDWGGLVAAVKMASNKWEPELLIVEKRATGISLFQSLSAANIPVIGIDVKEGKKYRAIRGTNAGSAQGWFRQHRVLFPSNASWLQVFKAELKDFSGDESARTDQVDAVVHLINYAITIGARASLLPTGWNPDRIVPDGVIEAARAKNGDSLIRDNRAEILTFIGDLPELTVDPYEGTCARCSYYDNGHCGFWHRQTVAVDVCERYNSINNMNNVAMVGILSGMVDD
ncbi:MAG: hypothetical protein KGJ90_00355 [Patescibacteria group bacterium]|nr:hypothetical protein [Patescibacteria group bacterium]